MIKNKIFYKVEREEDEFVVIRILSTGDGNLDGYYKSEPVSLLKTISKLVKIIHADLGVLSE